MKKLSPSFDFSAYLDLFHRHSIGITTAAQLKEIAESGADEIDYVIDELQKAGKKPDGMVEAGLPGLWALRLRTCLSTLAASE